MPDRPSDLRRPVRLEDLLRLKRAERPPSEFWTEFDRELRERQLASLVEKKSWWHELAAAFNRVGRLRLPLGATAVLALTLLSIHRYAQPVSDGRPEIGARPPEPVVAMIAVTPPARVELAAAPGPVVARVLAPSPASSPTREGTTAPAAETTALATGEVAGIIPWLGDIALDRMTASGTTTLARPIAVNVSSLSVVEPELADATAYPLGFEERAMPAMHRRLTADVLPTAAAAAAPRRARLLAVLDSAGAFLPEPAAPEHVKRSATRYLMQSDGDRSLSRLETERNGLSIRF